MKSVLKTLAVLILLLVWAFLIEEGYYQSWTGFQGYTNNKGEFIPPKKLWDWLQLLIVPILLAVGVWWLNKSQKQSDQQIETNRQQQKVLADYFDCMTDLLLKEKLRDPANNKESRSIARTRTLAILRILDGSRKAQALQFLYESGLINKNPIVQLNGADLTGAKLKGATLNGAELRGVHLSRADLKRAQLADADLRGSDLSYADLTQANLINTNLKQANFDKATVRKTRLEGAIWN